MLAELSVAQALDVVQSDSGHLVSHDFTVDGICDFDHTGPHYFHRFETVQRAHEQAVDRIHLRALALSVALLIRKDQRDEGGIYWGKSSSRGTSYGDVQSSHRSRLDVHMELGG